MWNLLLAVFSPIGASILPMGFFFLESVFLHSNDQWYDSWLLMWSACSKMSQSAKEGKGRKSSQLSICQAQCPRSSPDNATSSTQRTSDSNLHEDTLQASRVPRARLMPPHCELRDSLPVCLKACHNLSFIVLFQSG